MTPPALERANAWAQSLHVQAFVGTESRLQMAIELLRRITQGTEADPWIRVAELCRRQQEIRCEITQIEADPTAEMLGISAVRVRYQQFSPTAREQVGERRGRREDGSTAGVRLDYRRVPERQVPLQRPNTDGLMLADTEEIADTPGRDHLRWQLDRRADYLCAQTLEEFQQADRAVTREGQVRDHEHHVKDDRRAVDDAERPGDGPAQPAQDRDAAVPAGGAGGRG